jgi:ribosomal protein L37AE/L43A
MKTKAIIDYAKEIDKQAVLSEFKPRVNFVFVKKKLGDFMKFYFLQNNSNNSVEKTIAKKCRKGKRSKLCIVCHEKEPKDKRTKSFIAICSECNRAYHGSCFVPNLRDNLE